MNSTEPRLSERLAAEVFDEDLAPLASARRDRGAATPFAAAPAAGMHSYFTNPDVPRMRAHDFEFPGGGAAEGLIEALDAYWRASADSDLCALTPGLRKTAAALRDEAAENDGAVSVFCYAMF